ncbi:exopolyphosphatase/guanosine-5'-triphosphate,3'-diphosphate pyrophosphatase [Mucilaginibacter yixingensis]|uniref:Exopolyphosphatase/guanosine-5'-triphosphate, 3'-diphosphate pyrophosphatase n=1 Tax=Mucilaginibacter yixingensis TaxID=1295612 RepID=A0A2T5J9Y9_9SPHI|nr:exopolyphosphatase [Mucilaginibacter yixingensis]PTQ96882.1 exopolyphosphatase/guanosine-5'-triphosphate,3'-diphosphate pyrophosphatase [Mucilaginibacter yixingensis]
MTNAEQTNTTKGPVAVMDLGTNTFHLLIADGQGSNYQELVHITEPVKLGQGGINKGVIQPDAFERGITTMNRFGDHIKQHHVKAVKAMATSAMRSTSNGPDFIAQVKQNTGIEIEIIDGNAEAAYIYQGVNASGCLGNERSLILDIGGGSVEFIICNNERIYWKQSFEIGAARLMDKFHQTDPIPADCIGELNEYLEATLQPLFEAAKQMPVSRVVGSSGAFETFAEVIELEKGNPFDLKTLKCMEFEEDDFIALTSRLIASSHQERAVIKGIIPLRVDMIVSASLVTRYVMHKLGIHQVAMTTWALKEGVLVGLLS